MTDINEFVHLHGHSHFSNWLGADAMGSPDQIVARAKELGLPSICITDHGSLMAAPFLCAAAKKDGIKPIVGAELYISHDLSYRPKAGAEGRRNYKHLVALAMNWEGVIELFDLLSKANDDLHFHYKPRNTLAECGQTKNVVFLTACAGGLLADEFASQDVEVLLGDVGPDRLYLEVQPHFCESQIAVNQKAVELSEKLGIGLVATQDFHYPTANLSTAHEFLLAMGQGKSWTDPKRFRYPVNDLFIKTKAEMVRAFMPMIERGAVSIDHVSAAINAAKTVGDKLNVEWKKLPVSLPVMSENPERDLMLKSIAGMKKFDLMKYPEYVERLQYEFGVMKDSGFLTYFLVLEDIISWSRSKGIMVGPARGSSGGSLICYLIGITQIDPIKHGLIFERFYRPGRIDLPDIDTDFEDERRDEVIAYIRERFGTNSVAGVSNYMMYGAKSAIKGVARVMELNGHDINKVTVSIGQVMDDDEVWNHEAVKALFKKNPIVEAMSKLMAGTMSGMGQHAAGMIIAGVPISDRSVVWTKEDRRIACWDKTTIEDLGLMKLDVLGLRTLSILRNAAASIKARHKIDLDYTQIPLDDAKTLDIFQKGMTTGVFQFESNGMRQILKSLKVEKFQTLSDVNALYRPGPMDLIPIYTACQTGRAHPNFSHPLLVSVLGPTFGVCVYQEQLMEIFRQVGGFTYAEADNMRKIVGKKLGPDEFRKHEGSFVAGAVKSGMDETSSRRVFSDLVSFAGYAFNKSHAVSYAMIGYWTAYLKAHFPAEFYAAHIANSDDQQIMMAAAEASRLNIRIVMPDVNKSHQDKYIVVSDFELLAPLSAIKGLGPKAAAAIYCARNGEMDFNGILEGQEGFSKETNDSLFKNEKDFLARVYKRVVNSKVQSLLKRIGAMDWSKQDAEEMHVARIECLSHIYKQNITVDPDALCDIYEPGRSMVLEKELRRWDTLARANHMTVVLPSHGKKAKIMLMFEKPTYKDTDAGFMGNGDDYKWIYRLFKEQFDMNLGSYYVTSYYKFKEPPLLYETVEAETLKLVQAEFEVVRPPLAIAFGRKPIEFFAGKGARVGEMHSQIVLKGKTPVICAMSPWSAVMEPAKAAEFDRIIETIKSVMV